MRENGGQYTHGAIWTLKALLELKDSNESYEIENMLNPITHGENLEIVKKYKGEPYVLAGDVYANKDMIGRSGWTWYTGAAAWYYKVIIEDMLGIKIKDNKMYFEPCIPNFWNEYRVNYKYKNTSYNILFKNYLKKENKVINIFVNGEKQNEKYIILEENKNDFTIVIEM